MIEEMVTNFEKIYGTEALISAIISSQNKLLIDKGITTEDELRSMLKTELMCRTSRNMKEISNDKRNPELTAETLKLSPDITSLENAAQTLINGYDECDSHVSLDVLVNNLRTALQHHLAKKLISTF